MGKIDLTYRERVDFAKIDTSVPVPNLIDIQKRSYDTFLQMDRLPEERGDFGLKAVFESLFPIADFKKTCSLEFVDYVIGNWECRCGKLQGLHHNRTQCFSCGHMIISDQYSSHSLTCDSCGSTNENLKAICDVCGTSVKLKVKYSVNECKERGLTFDAPLKVTVRLVVWDKDEAGQTLTLPRDIKEQEVYFGDIPLMTEQGTFIINGTERVIVSQMHRSPGVFYSEGSDAGTYHCQIIPYRGSWIEFETDSKGNLYVRIDRKRKFLGTTFIRALGSIDPEIHSNESILCKFQEIDQIRIKGKQLWLGHCNGALGSKVSEDILNEKGEIILAASRKVTKAALRKMKTANIDWYPIQLDPVPKMILASDAINEETGEILAEANTLLDEETLARLLEEEFDVMQVFFPEVDPAGEILANTLGNDSVRSPEEALVEIYRKMRPGDPPTVDSSRKLFQQMFFDNQRYDFSRVGRLKFCTKLSLEKDLSQRILTPLDFYATIAYLLKLHRGQGQVDDIDHLGNRRVRSVGELLENQLRVGLVRMQRAIKEKMSLYNDLNTIMPHELINAKPVMASVKEFFGSSQLSQFMDQTNPLSEITHKRRLSALGPGGLSRERAGFEVRDVHTSHYGRICPIETPEGPNIGLISSLSCYARINEFGFIESPYYRVQDGIVIREVKVINPGESGFKKDDIITMNQADEINKSLAKKKKTATDRVTLRALPQRLGRRPLHHRPGQRAYRR